ncbi:hypothetical protein NIES4071_78900 [Calothrix sp. NIES-4071]|nr:hypothetical protein NIES4071_78900 [Calothrix sp. NIES-4071]BAZ62162.1 hypothetical protein NIES4105_78830 [Calothrix sp. NIES-4105]
MFDANIDEKVEISYRGGCINIAQVVVKKIIKIQNNEQIITNN